jgi:hypothetical protein
MILTLARGHYCPKEHQQHLQLAAFQSQIGVGYTKIATISTDTHHTSQEFRASVGAQWPFLEDPERIVQKDLDIQKYTDPENDPMIPHRLVLAPGLVIHSIYMGYWFWGRPSVDELRLDLRDVMRTTRRDWDLSAAGLREAWEAGDASPFHGGTRAGSRTSLPWADVSRLPLGEGGAAPGETAPICFRPRRPDRAGVLRQHSRNGAPELARRQRPAVPVELQSARLHL